MKEIMRNPKFKKWLEDLSTLETIGVLPISNTTLHEIKTGKLDVAIEKFALIYSFNIHTPNIFRPRQLFTEYTDMNDQMLINQLNLEEKVFPILLTYWTLLQNVGSNTDLGQKGLEELEFFFHLIIEDTKIEYVKKALVKFKINSEEKSIFKRLGSTRNPIKNYMMEGDFINFLDELIKDIDENSKY
tara:strand:- start:1352 stop:1912 length:561 start_codon:yes stop_codon:yes gene_type:complete